MSGFYVRHLKSSYARKTAPEIEEKLLYPTVAENGKSVFVFQASMGHHLGDYLAATYAVLRDRPDIFYYEVDVRAEAVGNRVTLQLPLLYSLEEIRTYKALLNKAIRKIVAGAETYGDAWEKEKYIFEYLQTHTDYSDERAHECHNIIGPLLLGKGVCEGISKAFAVLCHHVGIPAIVVTDEKHMWNMVNIEGDLVYVDATYNTKAGGSVDYSYFNVTDNEMLMGRSKEIDCIPACTTDRHSFYFREGTLFNSPRELKFFLIGNVFKRRVYHVKLKSGSIETVLHEASFFVPYNFQYIYNPKLNTAIIHI